MNILEALCSAQRALLETVTPNLRVCVLDIVGEGNYHLYFYFAQPLSEEEGELVSLAYTYFAADFPFEYKIDCTIEVLPMPQKIPDFGRCVYARYEGDLD